MNTEGKKLISIIIPVYNEEKNILPIYNELRYVFSFLPFDYEIIYVNDGSSDNSQNRIEKLSERDERVHFIEFSRNFGKELATTAGYRSAKGDAAIAIDSDLQHPPALIPEFLRLWMNKVDVVVGVRNGSKSDHWIKRQGSKYFYKFINLISHTKMVPNSTDFRLIDRCVLEELNKIAERNRVTRGLVDWLGFKSEYVYFDAKQRIHGESSYSIAKLFDLALSGFISHSYLPLRFAGYAGLLIMIFSGILSVVMFVDHFVIRSYLNFSGPAMLAVLILFLVGFILVCIGLLAYYIGNIFENTRHRPLYIIRNKK